MARCALTRSSASCCASANIESSCRAWAEQGTVLELTGGGGPGPLNSGDSVFSSRARCDQAVYSGKELGVQVGRWIDPTRCW
jgi:hypothetical protein